MNKKALGKGLGVFLPDDYGILKDERYAEVDIEEVSANPLQPRMKFDPESIEELARSIKESGVIQPLLVVPEGETLQDHRRGTAMAGGPEGRAEKNPCPDPANTHENASSRFPWSRTFTGRT